MREYVFDTTILSNLAAADRLDLLEARYGGSAFTTIEVCDELRKGIKAGYAHLELALQHVGGVSGSGWLRILAPETAEEYRLRSEFDLLLDPGESSCLALAMARGLVLATDDLAARRLAQCRGVDLTGTIGILVALVRDGRLALEQANATLAAMIARGYRAPVDRLDALV